MKQRGFAQSIYSQSATKNEELGTVRIDHLGKVWRYCRAGSTALAVGRVVQGVTLAAAHQNEAITSAVEVGERNLSLTVTSGTAIAANELAGGEFMINDGAGQGHTYQIVSNTAITSSGTAITISLARGIAVALDTTSEFTLVRSPWYGAVVSTTVTIPVIGVTPIAVTASYYFWAQRRGLACVLGDSTGATIGQPVKVSNATAGAVEVVAAVTDSPTIGYLAYGTVNTEHSPIWLTLE